MVRVYLTNDVKTSKLVKRTGGGIFREFLSRNITNFETFPYIELPEEPLLLSTLNGEDFSKFFLQATLLKKNICFPVARTLGYYSYGAAYADLTRQDGGGYELLIRTNCWEGISDMFILKSKLMTGNILPDNSFEGVQQLKPEVEIKDTPQIPCQSFEIERDSSSKLSVEDLGFLKSPDLLGKILNWTVASFQKLRKLVLELRAESYASIVKEEKKEEEEEEDLSYVVEERFAQIQTDAEEIVNSETTQSVKLNDMHVLLDAREKRTVPIKQL